jgi:two-component SAPR family response regulator
MNGWELAEEMKKTWPKIKVIFISGYPRDVLSQQGILSADINLVQKPFEMEELARHVRKLLDEK